MDTQSLKAFIAVAEQKSFSAAAESLYLTQSAVSKRIKQLEEQLGTTLFDRHNRTISLTEAGEALLPRAQHILDLVSDTELELENISGDISGSLTLATSHHIGLHRLPPVLRKFVHAHPNVDLDLQFMGSERAYQAVRLRQVDLALTTLEQTPKSDIAAIPLWQDDMVCVCAANHRLAGIPQISLQDLSSEPAILPEPDTITYQLINHVFAAEGLTLKAPMPTNYLETIKMLVSVGMGWSVLPSSMVNDDALTVINWPGTSLRRQLGAVFLKHRTQSNAATALMDLLHASADD
ncbi:MAG TPA: LysR family transcriptional regulator [Oceanospirillales bacterium]|jgi:DNA-binding transcriptional LysR family regulator|nr:LysR family transcriptional regulator [Pseudomonadota bacterium]HCG80301.1 LysR family transcriptional regulator [Oceanospirillales bacterium]